MHLTSNTIIFKLINCFQSFNPCKIHLNTSFLSNPFLYKNSKILEYFKSHKINESEYPLQFNFFIFSEYIIYVAMERPKRDETEEDLLRLVGTERLRLEVI